MQNTVPRRAPRAPRRWQRGSHRRTRARSGPRRTAHMAAPDLFRGRTADQGTTSCGSRRKTRTPTPCCPTSAAPAPPASCAEPEPLPRSAIQLLVLLRRHASRSGEKAEVILPVGAGEVEERRLHVFGEAAIVRDAAGEDAP